MYLKKPAQPVNGSTGPAGNLSLGKLFTKFPALLEFLSAATWEDGSPRASGSIRLLVEGGRWKCSLNDPENKRYAFLSGSSPDDLLEGCEKHLRDDSVDWRPDRPKPSGGRR